MSRDLPSAWRGARLRPVVLDSGRLRLASRFGSPIVWRSLSDVATAELIWNAQYQLGHLLVHIPELAKSDVRSYGSSVDRQQAAPGNYPRFAMLADVPDRVMKRRF